MLFRGIELCRDCFFDLFAVDRVKWQNRPSSLEGYKVRERRRFNRFNLQGRVFLQLAGQKIELPAADISVTGVGVFLDSAIFGTKPTGEVGSCRIESPDLACPIEAYVSVMRIQRLGKHYLVGLRFESIADEYLRVIQAFQTLFRIRERRAAA